MIDHVQQTQSMVVSPLKTGATASLARFALNLSFEDIPRDVVEIAKEQLVATIGSCFAGATLPAAKSIEAGLGVLGDGQTATLFGTSRRLPAPSAALFNSATAQALDWDDWVIISHTGAAVIPTAFAAGEYVGATGRDIITAVVIGNEINGRTSRAIQKGAYVGNSLPNHQVETALISSRLLGLTQVEAERAVGHSGFMAMESCHVGWMTDSKLLCNGLPAMWGLVAASLAKSGLIGNRDLLEHPAGLLSTVSEVVDLEQLDACLGSEWQTRTLNTKRHASCAYNLAAIECAIALRERVPALDPDRIERLIVEGPGVMLYVGARFQALEPDIYTRIEQDDATHVALCFDAGYAVASALLDGEMTHRQYLKSRILSDDIRRLGSRISFRADPDMHAAYYADYQYGARLRLTMSDGSEYVEERRQLLGARDRPFDHADKFQECAADTLSTEQIKEAIDMLRNMDEIDDIRRVTNVLTTR